ncbi:MAG: bifunctional hydroxymethylpyrimidine kinase/phosphomethylpyrimidine kinase [Candidatus Tectomicrobia bacterium]|nr:bifunctional hydroxymethylpyrimidine kinase/phosphomethylpyrimidine kinase [Candidatus Tectomicrobia bacterium]
MKVALTIAGSDSGGGAGIQADLKAFAAMGVHGMTAITSITAQNTVGVQGIHDLPPEFVQLQIDSVVQDIGVDAVKTGMLSNTPIIEAICEKIREYHLETLVVDPVLVAKGGASLLRPEAKSALVEKLLPLAYITTPNLEEAQVLADMKIRTLEEMQEAARKIHALGPRHVLVKGGHFPGDAIDILFDGKEFTEYRAPRIDTQNTHGTGCTYASAIAAGLAKGEPLKLAIEKAKAYVTRAIKESLAIGKGFGPVNHMAQLYRESARYAAIVEIERALDRLREGRIGTLTPEVQSNLGFAIPHAESADDVVAIPGRIVRVGDEIKTVAAPKFGASRHIANIILTVMKFNPEKRAAMNIRYAPEIVDVCRKLNMAVASFSRSDEPEVVKKREGSSLEWGTETAIKQFGSVPDIIYDLGDIGKEPMIRVIGETPGDVAEKVLKIRKAL